MAKLNDLIVTIGATTRDFDMELHEFEEHITLAHVTQCFDVLGEYSDQKKA